MRPKELPGCSLPYLLTAYTRKFEILVTGRLPLRHSWGFVTLPCGEGTRDEPLRTSAWEASSEVVPMILKLLLR